MFKKVIISLILTISIFQIIWDSPSTHAAATLDPKFATLIKKAVPSSEAEQFIAKIETVASNLKASPNDLVAAIYLETDGTFSPTVRPLQKNGIPISSAIGLIQFLKASANDLGTAECRYETEWNRVNPPDPTIGKLSRVEQMDCVEAFFQRNGRLPSYDLASLYATIHRPAARNYPMNACWYEQGSKEWVNNNVLATYGEVASNGKICVTKNSVIKAISAKLQRTGVGAYSPPSSELTGSLTPSEIYDSGWQERQASDAAIAAAQEELENRQFNNLSKTLENTYALPANIFANCSISTDVKSDAPLINYDQFIQCFKSINTYVFIVAVIYVVILITSSNLSTIFTAGGKGSNPVANTRKRLEKSLIGLVLIGAPFLILDLFADLSNFNIVPLESLPKITIASIKIDSGIPEEYLKSDDGRIYLPEELTGALSYPLTDPGSLDPRLATFQPRSLTNGGVSSNVGKDCKGNNNCKVLQVAYAPQQNAGGASSPWGGSACGAASVVMIANYLKPDLFDNSTGRNNLSNLTLRENIFYASSYFKQATKDKRPRCYETYSPAGTGRADVDGAWAFTSANVGNRCFLNDFSGMINYLSIYKLKAIKIPDSDPAEIRKAIDRGNPVLFRATSTKIPDGHIMVIKGYDKTRPNNFVMNDPLGDFTKASNSNPVIGNGIIYNINQLGGKVAYEITK